MRQRGFYLLVLSLTLLLIYGSALLYQDDFQYTLREPMEQHPIAFIAIFNILIHFSYWSSRQRSKAPAALDTFDDGRENTADETQAPGVFPHLLFPFGFLLNLGGLTYLLLFIADHWSAGRQIWMQHWFPLIFLTLAGMITFLYGTLSFLKEMRPTTSTPQ